MANLTYKKSAQDYQKRLGVITREIGKLRRHLKKEGLDVEKGWKFYHRLWKYVDETINPLEEGIKYTYETNGKRKQFTKSQLSEELRKHMQTLGVLIDNYGKNVNYRPVTPETYAKIQERGGDVQAVYRSALNETVSEGPLYAGEKVKEINRRELEVEVRTSLGECSFKTRSLFEDGEEAPYSIKIKGLELTLSDEVYNTIQSDTFDEYQALSALDKKSISYLDLLRLNLKTALIEEGDFCGWQSSHKVSILSQDIDGPKNYRASWAGKGEVLLTKGDLTGIVAEEARKAYQRLDSSRKSHVSFDDIQDIVARRMLKEKVYALDQLEEAKERKDVEKIIQLVKKYKGFDEIVNEANNAFFEATHDFGEDRYGVNRRRAMRRRERLKSVSKRNNFSRLGFAATILAVGGALAGGLLFKGKKEQAEQSKRLEERVFAPQETKEQFTDRDLNFIANGVEEYVGVDLYSVGNHEMTNERRIELGVRLIQHKYRQDRERGDSRSLKRGSEIVEAIAEYFEGRPQP